MSKRQGLPSSEGDYFGAPGLKKSKSKRLQSTESIAMNPIEIIPVPGTSEAPARPHIIGVESIGPGTSGFGTGLLNVEPGSSGVNPGTSNILISGYAGPSHVYPGLANNLQPRPATTYTIPSSGYSRPASTYTVSSNTGASCSYVTPPSTVVPGPTQIFHGTPLGFPGLLGSSTDPSGGFMLPPGSFTPIAGPSAFHVPPSNVSAAVEQHRTTTGVPHIDLRGINLLFSSRPHLSGAEVRNVTLPPSVATGVPLPQQGTSGIGQVDQTEPNIGFLLMLILEILKMKYAGNPNLNRFL